MKCPDCGDPMWDNRESKRNPKAPDYKCKDRDCDGAIWLDSLKKRGTARASAHSNGSDDRQDHIERQHSQEMALRYFALNGTVPTTAQLRDMVSWFQRDIRQSSEPTRKTKAPEPDPEEEEEEIPF